MSLINKMLQELDKRHAPQAVQATTAPLAANVRPVKAAHIGSELFWWVVAAALLLAIAWLGWVMWQLTPRPVVNELALRAPTKVSPASTAAALAETPNAEAPTVAASAPPQAPSVAVGQPLAPSPAVRVDMLKLATEITTEIPSRPARNAASAATSKVTVAKAERPLAEPRKPAPAVAGEVAAPAASQPLARPSVPPDIRIDKRVLASARERAEIEYRRATTLINQGRMSEGMEGLRSALGMDGSYDSVRQTLVGLLLEQRRMDEAVLLLQRGLDLAPGNTGFAMLLARILVDRPDVSGALAVLRKHAPVASNNPDFHAFVAALQQRLGNHKEAIEEYQLALRLSPQSGMWWMGLGISQEASGRKKEAAEAFRQARASGNLGGDLLAFVDQRLRQLQ